METSGLGQLIPYWDFIKELHKNLLTAFSNKETYNYMKKNKHWQELINDNLNILAD